MSTTPSTSASSSPPINEGFPLGGRRRFVHGVERETTSVTNCYLHQRRATDIHCPHRRRYAAALLFSMFALVAAFAGASRPDRASTSVPVLVGKVETLSIQRADDSRITAYVERNRQPARQSVLLILQGSQCESVAPDASDRMLFEMPTAMTRLDIEKYAITSDRHGSAEQPCPADYLQHNSIDQRVLDVLTVVAALRQQAAWWNGRLYLMGTSEGATVAAMAGPLLAETQGIVLVNGSIGRPFRDGWSDAIAASVAAAGGNTVAQTDVRAEAGATWEKARRNPTPDEQAFGNGNTLKWWNSIIDLRPSNLLALTNTPILLLQADHDEMTPASSARAVSAQFKASGRTNLDYVELPGLTHGLRTLDGKPGWEPVLTRIRAWLLVRDAAPRRLH